MDGFHTVPRRNLSGPIFAMAGSPFANRNRQIRGAAVDVFSEEPPKKDNPLLKLEQVILTPHIGSNTVECMDRIALDVAEDVHLVLSGENPKHPIKR